MSVFVRAAPCLRSEVWPRRPRVKSVDSLRSLLRGSFGGLLLGASSAEDANNAIIPLVAGVLIDRNLSLRHGNRDRPGSCPRRGIVDRVLELDRVSIDAPEALDHMQVRA